MAFPTWVEVVTGGWVVHSRHGVEGEGVARSLRNVRYVKQICKRSRCKCVCVCQGLAGVAVWWRATPCDRWLSTVVVVVVYEALFCHVMLFCLFFLCLSSFVCPLFFLPLIFLCMSLFLLLIICLLLFFLHSSSSSFLILCLLVLFFLLDTLPLTCHLSSWYSTSYVSSSFLHPLPSWYSLLIFFSLPYALPFCFPPISFSTFLPHPLYIPLPSSSLSPFSTFIIFSYSLPSSSFSLPSYFSHTPQHQEACDSGVSSFYTLKTRQIMTISSFSVVILYSISSPAVSLLLSFSSRDINTPADEFTTSEDALLTLGWQCTFGGVWLRTLYMKWILGFNVL